MDRDTVNEWLLLTRKVAVSYKFNWVNKLDMLERRPALRLGDKLVLSIQASEMHYCVPRGNTGPYSHVEVGVMEGGVPKLLKRYTYDGEHVSVVGFVPVSVVNYLIEKHGGVKGLGQ